MLVKFAPWWSWTAGSRCYLRTNPKGNVSASVLIFWEHLSWTPPGDVLSMHIFEGQRMLLGNSSEQIEDILRTSRGSHKAENLYHNQKNTFDKNFSNNQWRHRMSITFRKHQLLYSDWDWCGYIVFLSPSLPETHSKKHFSYLLIHKNLGVVQLWTNFDYSTDQFNPAFKIFLRLCRPNWDWIHEPPQNILMTILLPLQQNFIQYDLQTVAHF